MQLRRELFEDPNGPGKTPQCPGCSAITRGRKAQGHWESCRERVENWLAEHDPETYYRALDRYVEGKRKEKERHDEEIVREAKRMKTAERPPIVEVTATAPSLQTPLGVSPPEVTVTVTATAEAEEENKGTLRQRSEDEDGEVSVS